MKSSPRREQRTAPDIPATIDFAPGIRLLGYSMEPTTIRPDDEMHMTYYWLISPNVDPRPYGVFAHFMQERILFQDDHTLLPDLSPALLHFLPSPTIITTTRQVPVPTDIPPGELTIRFGLLRHRHNTRVKPSTDLPQRRRAVELPRGLTVSPAQ